MKYFFTAILTLSILSYQFSEILVYASFKINQDYIAKNLCVEKDVEDSTCKGCCQLKKKVNEQQEQKKALPPAQTDKQNINFCQHGSDFHINANNEIVLLFQQSQNEYQFLMHQTIYHPPDLIS